MPDLPPPLVYAAAGVVLCLLLVVRRRRRPAPGPNPGFLEKKLMNWSSMVFGRMPGDRRAARRRGGGCVAVLVTDAAGAGKPVEGAVLDRSVGGLAIDFADPLPGQSAADAFAAGAVLSVRPVHADESVGWVQVEVRYCQRHADGWRVGCRFVKPPPYNILVLFG